MASVGKLFGKAPSDYFLMEDGGFWFAFDLACATVYLEVENQQYKQSTETAQNQASMIGQNLDQYRQKLNENSA
jgi:hypothetical protein